MAATGVLLVIAMLAGYASRVLGDSDRFADRAASALQHPDVRAVIADRVTDDVVLRANADLIAARPIIASAVSGIVGGDAFAGLFRRSLRDVHAAVYRRDQDTVTLTLVDLGTVLTAALEVIDPELATEVQSRRPPTVLRDKIVGGDLLRVAGVLAWLAAALALAAAIAAVAVSPDRRRTVSRLGLAAIVAGLVVVAAELIAKGVVLGRIGEDERAAAGAVWDAFLGDLGTAGWVLAACGAIVTAAAASLLRPIDVDRPVRVAWRALATEPASTPARVARGLALVRHGALVLIAAAVRAAARRAVLGLQGSRCAAARDRCSRCAACAPAARLRGGRRHAPARPDGRRASSRAAASTRRNRCCPAATATKRCATGR